MAKKFHTELYMHVGGQSRLVRSNRDVLKYDRTSEAALIAHTRRNEQPLYEVKSHAGVTLDLVHTLKRARQIRDIGGSANGRYILEMNTAGKKRRVE